MVGDELVQMWSLLRDLGEAKKLDTAVLRSIHPEALTLETWIRIHRAPMAGNP